MPACRRLHVFPYSPRKRHARRAHAPAARRDLVKERAARLRAKGDGRAARPGFRRHDRRAPHGAGGKGGLRPHAPALRQWKSCDGPALPGSILTVHITGRRDEHLTGHCRHEDIRRGPAAAHFFDRLKSGLAKTRRPGRSITGLSPRRSWMRQTVAEPGGSLDPRRYGRGPRPSAWPAPSPRTAMTRNHRRRSAAPSWPGEIAAALAPLQKPLAVDRTAKSPS